MALASTGTDIVTGICMAVVLGMSGVLLYRATRARPEDADEQDPDLGAAPPTAAAPGTPEEPRPRG